MKAFLSQTRQTSTSTSLLFKKRSSSASTSLFVPKTGGEKMAKLKSKKKLTPTRASARRTGDTDESTSEEAFDYIKSFTGAKPSDLVTDSHYVILERLLQGDESEPAKKRLLAFKSGAKLQPLMLYLTGYIDGLHRYSSGALRIARVQGLETDSEHSEDDIEIE